MKRILIIFTPILFIGCIVETTTMYTLNVSSNPTEGGIINPSSGEYEEGTEVTIRVSPNTNYSFDKWEGDWNGSESPLILVMDGDKNLVGNFKFSDSDADGVANDYDLCDNTRNGVPVDDNGCMLNPIYLDDNGVTIKSHEWGEVGDVGEVDGVNYTIVNIEQLRELIFNDNDFQNICTSKISDMSSLFKEGLSHNYRISSWDVSNVTDMSSMFQSSMYSDNLSYWDVSSVTNMYRMFSAYSRNIFYVDISDWDVSNVTNMGEMFEGSSLSNEDISNWDVSSVINMNGMFWATEFNGDISNWDVSNVTDMGSMFYDNPAINQNLSSWNVYEVINCGSFSKYTQQWTLPKPNFTNCDPN